MLFRSGREDDMNTLIRKPSAWIPIVMSLTALSAMLIYFVISGIPIREPDEGTPAHLFQLWLIIEVLMMVVFATKWVLREPKQTLLILAIQIIAVLVVCAPVFYLGL